MVAPTKRMLLSSIAGRKMSYWALLKQLKLWSSSKNSTVLAEEWPPRICILFRASSMASLMSLTIAMTIERATNLKDEEDDADRALAIDVFPVPGGPQWIKFGSFPRLTADRRIDPGPSI